MQEGTKLGCRKTLIHTKKGKAYGRQWKLKLKQFVSESLPPGSHFTTPPITADMVKAYLPKFPANKATGIDEISCALLCLDITELAPSIAKLVNLSLSTGTFPCRWKQARVSALIKDGNMDDVNKYRPIFVLPLLLKIIE